MGVLAILNQAQLLTGEAQISKLKEAFAAYPSHAARSFKVHFKSLYDSLPFYNTADETIFRFLNPDRCNDKCPCGAALKYRGPVRGYGQYCSTKCAGASESVKSRRIETVIKKYGVKHVLQSEEIKKQVAETNLARYGNICSAQGETQAALRLAILRQKAQTTVKKAKATVQLKYGVPCATHLQQVKDARRLSELKLWLGAKKPARLKELEAEFDVWPMGDVNDRYTPVLWQHKCGGCYTATIDLAHKCSICHSSARSKPEREMLDFVRTLLFAESGVRNIIAPFELDIFVPSKNVAIELNGAYWHRDKDDATSGALLNKTKKCATVGIKLLHFWDYEWIHQRPIVKSMRRNALGCTPLKLNARALTLDLEVPVQEARDFCNQNHIQGYARSTIRIGLRDKDGKLVQLLTASKPRFNRSAELELVRVCTILNTNIRGGFTRMLSALGNASILTYADLRFYTGETYAKAGFEFIRATPPNYSWVKDDLVLPRYACQKHKLSMLLENFDPSKTEIQNMRDNKWIKHSDCGSNLFLRK